MATQTINIQVKDKTAGALSNIDRRLKGIEGTMVGVNKVAGLAAGALGAIGGVNVIGSIVKTTARFQDLRTALASVTGSAREGASAFAFVSQFATQTQFGVDTLSEAFIKLKAAGIEPTQKLLTTFTDTAAVTTDQLGTLTAMTDLFARTTSGGLGLEELNRLADRGVPVFKILEEQLGITRLEVSEFGKTAEGARKITEALTAGLDASFGGATAERANNLSTAISNMQIGFQNVQDAVGSGGFGGALTELVNLFNEALARVIPLAKQIGEDLGFGIFQATKFLRENTFELGQFIKGATILASVLGGAGLIKVLSGVAMETEFQLLNARLSEKGDNMELAEEQLWKCFAAYYGREYNGYIDYPDSFNIKDTHNEFAQLETASKTATDPRIKRVIDERIVELLAEDPKLVLPVSDFVPHTMYDEQGNEYMANTEAEHLAMAAQGYSHEKPLVV